MATSSTISRVKRGRRLPCPRPVPGPPLPRGDRPARLAQPAPEPGLHYHAHGLAPEPGLQQRPAGRVLLAAPLAGVFGGPLRCQLPRGRPVRHAVVDAAAKVGVEVEHKIAGPSNIGNYLADLNIPATAGFGVDYVGLHGTDERIRLDTIPTIQAVYHAAVLALLGA
uniref:hypothetical protein n=1 Tax=Amycolatopsis sp. CA-096443 TaxID=3239919 RepID=UPI003F49172A